MAEGERDGGNEEKEGWRCRDTGAFCDDDEGGGCGCEADGGVGLWAMTCIAAARAIVSIFAASPALL